MTTVSVNPMSELKSRVKKRFSLHRSRANCSNAAGPINLLNWEIALSEQRTISFDSFLATLRSFLSLRKSRIADHSWAITPSKRAMLPAMIHSNLYILTDFTLPSPLSNVDCNCAGFLEQSMGARNRVVIGLSYRPARAGILKQSRGARNRVEIGLSYRPARLHRLAEFIPCRNRFLGFINVYKYGFWLHRVAESVPWNRFLGSLKV
jgi:hypothetical protein